MRLKFDRLTPTGLIRLVAEAVLLFLVAWAPWPFASVEYGYEAILIGGTTLLVLLWLAHAFFTGHLALRPDSISYTLLGLIALTLIQLVPLPESIVGIVSPTRLQLHQQLLPQLLEQFPGETNEVARSTWLPITCDVFFTRVFLAQLVGLLLIYTVVRSWLSSRESLRRLAWVLAFNGFLLALVGIAQFFSSPRNVVFWQVETAGAVFGPFICKNHFPDYVLFCLGLGMGLLVSHQPPKSVKIKGVVYKVSALSKITDSPGLVIIGSGLILIVMSIPFTLSRGGLLATLVAGAAVAVLVYRTRGSLSRSAAIVGAILLGAVLLGGWYGWGVVSERLGTLWTGKAGEQRGSLWTDVATLIPQFAAVGSGNGTFSRIEPIARTHPSVENYVMENAHNEYLEAILEGGLPRLLLTLLLCYLCLRTTISAYLRLRERSSGPLVLGILFGLVGLIVHSFVDFGIHMPAIAFLAAVLVAFAADAATDPTYIPYKKKSLDGPQPDLKRRFLKGPVLYAFAAVLAAVSIALIWDSSHRGLAENLQVTARDAARVGTLRQHEVRLEALTAAVALTPTDGYAWTELALAHFDAAEDECRVASMALAGSPAGLSMPQQAYWQPVGAQVRAGLEAARTARQHSPLLPRPHLFMALYGGGFAKSEKPIAHLDRATRICPTDPELYLLRGNDAAREKNLPLAIEEWQKAMTLSPLKVPAVLVAAGRVIPPEQILSRLLPSEPLALWAAVEQLYPRYKAESAKPRTPYLQRLVALDGAKDWTSYGWAAIGRAHAELGRSEAAYTAWSKAVAKEPDSYDLRNALAQWLEEDERYDAAEEQLLWLLTQKPSSTVEARLAAVRHARKLQGIIRGQ